MTSLEEAIATHPQLWERLGKAWKRQNYDSWADGYYKGRLESLCGVGGFDEMSVETRLLADFGEPIRRMAQQ